MWGSERWGDKNADHYAAHLHHRLQALLDFPGMGAVIRGPKNTRWLLSGRHRIVYRVDPNEIRVIRFLHVKQDFGRHLEGGKPKRA
jgi:plasmid stabilization system protein ParE